MTGLLVEATVVTGLVIAGIGLGEVAYQTLQTNQPADSPPEGDA